VLCARGSAASAKTAIQVSTDIVARVGVEVWAWLVDGNEVNVGGLRVLSGPAAAWWAGLAQEFI